MKNLNIYLTFNGNCEEAMNFYQSVLGGSFSYIGRFKDMPPSDDFPQPLTEEIGERIMHIHLVLPNNLAILASDTFPDRPVTQSSTNFSISIDAESEEEATKFFNGLMKGGEITMPLQKTFWGAFFGMGVDKFGIQWMLNYDYPTSN